MSFAYLPNFDEGIDWVISRCCGSTKVTKASMAP